MDICVYFTVKKYCEDSYMNKCSWKINSRILYIHVYDIEIPR